MKRTALLVLLVLILPQVSSHSSDNRNKSVNADADAKSLSDATSMSSVTGGDQVISGGDTFAASHGLGDVDIEGCIVTKQWGSFIISHQYYDYDVFCIADKLDTQGRHHAAAVVRCTDKDMQKLFGDKCIPTWTFKAPAPPVITTPNQGDEAPTSDEDNWDDDDGPDHEDAYEALLERVAKIEREKAANVRRYNRDQAQRVEKEEVRKASAQSYLDRLPPPVQQQQEEEICCLQQAEESPDGN